MLLSFVVWALGRRRSTGTQNERVAVFCCLGLGSIFGRLGVSLFDFWSFWGGLSGVLGDLLDVLGALGPLLGDLGSVLAALGRSWADFGRF